MDTQLLSGEPTEIVLTPKPNKRKLKVFMVLTAVFAITALILLIVVVTRKTTCDESALEKENESLKQQLNDLNGKTSQLQATIDSLSQQIAQMKRDNETLYYYKELFLDQLQIEALQLQLKSGAPALSNLPVIKKININNNSLTGFCGNVLPDTEFVNLAFNDIVAFENNSLPLLSGLNFTAKETGLPIRTFVNNTIGKLQKLSFLTGTQLMSFNQNNLPMVEFLDLSNTSLTTFHNNILPKVQNIVLENTYLSVLEISSMPNLKYLTADHCGLVRIDCNDLPLLEYLSVYDNLLKSLGKNTWPLVNTLYAEINSLTNLTELQQFPVLDVAILHTNRYINADNIIHPKLTYLDLMKNPVLVSFKNNLILKLVTLRLDDSPLLISDGFTDNQLPELTGFFASRTGLTTFTDKLRNSLPKLNNIELRGTPLQEFDYPDVEAIVRFLDISMTPLTAFTKRVMPLLERLNINSSQIADFSDNTVPVLAELDAQEAQLADFDCAQLPSIQVLLLSKNQLSDAFADALVACNLQKIKTIDISGNKLVDTDAALRKLKAKYP